MHRLLGFALAVMMVASSAWAQGFPLPMFKKSVIVGRMLPASVNLNKKHILVEASAEASVPDAVAKNLPSLLKTKLVTMIQHDPRLIVEEVHPETALRFKITNFYTEKYVSGTGTTQYTTWRGKMEVAYQAVEVASGKVVDSENLQVAFGYEPAKDRPSISQEINPFGRRTGARDSENVVKDDLVDGIVAAMGKRVSPVEEPLEVLLPGKKLEPLSALAIAHRWGTLELQADKMEKFLKPDDDTYRMYLVALAKEAQAYDLAREANAREMGKRPEIPEQEARAQFKQAQKFMDEARVIYKEIVEANPKEKNFRPGDTRTEEAIKIYAEIERNWGQRQNPVLAPTPALSESGSRNAGAPVAAEAAPAAKLTTPLDRVIEFCKMGIDAPGITDYINSPDFMTDAKATNYKFNFGTDMLALNNSCKVNASTFQKLMRQRLDPSATSAVAPAATATPAARKTAPGSR